jgi:hypothetical protein
MSTSPREILADFDNKAIILRLFPIKNVNLENIKTV